MGPLRKEGAEIFEVQDLDSHGRGLHSEGPASGSS